jgi:hypothetical protein
VNVYFINNSDGAVLAQEVFDSVPRVGELVTFTVNGPALRVVSVIWNVPVRAVQIRVA